jgi:hypothetical protein
MAQKKRIIATMLPRLPRAQVFLCLCQEGGGDGFSGDGGGRTFSRGWLRISPPPKASTDGRYLAKALSIKEKD